MSHIENDRLKIDCVQRFDEAIAQKDKAEALKAINALLEAGVPCGDLEQEFLNTFFEHDN